MGEARLFRAFQDRRQVPPGVLDQAVQWVTLLQSGMAGPNDLDACRRWRAEHVDHELAWQRLERLRGDLRQGTAGAPPPLARGVLARGAAAHDRRRAIKWVVGGLSVGAVGLLVSGRVPLESPLLLAADYRTGVGERQRVSLPDGSQMVLNTGSAVDIDFAAGQRVVVLQRGEIHLETAAHAQSGPLVVRLGQAQARPLGTRFAVRQFDSGYGRVSVREGAVAVRYRPGEPELVVHAGQQGGFGQQGWQGVSPLADLSDSWVSGALVVERMPLSDFLQELGRYRRGLLRCDPAVAQLPVSGAFQLADTDAILDALAAILPVNVRRVTPYWVTISPAATNL